MFKFGRDNLARANIISGFIALAVILTLIFPLASSFAQGSDDNYNQSGNPCQAGNNPDKFQLFPGQGAAGSFFIIKGKPHDPRTVGPGSDVDFTWREDPSGPGFSTQVDNSGGFAALIKVPDGFAPGPHQLMYEEASPYASCLAFTVTGPSQASPPLFPQLGPLSKIINLFLNLLHAFFPH